jgi:peptidoglycan hydrolase-like protein with peptidoglycan-binding domain
VRETLVVPDVARDDASGLDERSANGHPVGRRRALWLLAGVALAVGTGGGIAVLRRPHHVTPVADQNVTTATVERTDLVNRVQVDGTLGYAGTYTVPGAGGVVTWLPALGAEITRGRPVYRADNRWVPLLYGGMPLWRTLESGCTGTDVRELQRNLKALGYRVTADGRYGSATATAVKHWWRDRGRTDGTRSVRPGDVAIAAGPIRVSVVSAHLGLPASGIVLTATSTQRRIVVPLPVDQQSLAVAGAQASVELPGGVSTTGHITAVGTVAQGGSTGSSAQGAQGAQVGQAVQSATIQVDITLDQPRVAGRLDAAPVTVGLTSAVRRGVLAVPVSALLALGAGSYAVSVVGSDGTRRRVPTTLGLFANGKVEVSGGGIAAGDRVEVPAG